MAVDEDVDVPRVRVSARAARCRVALSDTTGWDVQLEIDDRIVTTTHCGEWHRVERMCAEIQRMWHETHTASSARR